MQFQSFFFFLFSIEVISNKDTVYSCLDNELTWLKKLPAFTATISVDYINYHFMWHFHLSHYIDNAINSVGSAHLIVYHLSGAIARANP